MDPANFVPLTKYAEEQELLVRAGDWLLPRLSEFENLPRQLIHGDWTPRNVLFDRSGDGVHLSSVLDFEAMAFDPVHVDVANTCSTLLMWSGLDNVDERIGRVLSTYEELSGRRLERDHVFTAMLAHWLCHYWSWRDRLKNGGFGQEVKERLCFRIASALDYVSRSGNPRYINGCAADFIVSATGLWRTCRRYSQAGSKGRKNVKVVPFLPGRWVLRTRSLP